MSKCWHTILAFVFPALWAISAQASGLEATLDRYEITVPMGSPTIIQASLHNSATAPVYLTGVKVQLSEGASGDIYNPALLHERLFKLEPGQSWGGPLAVVRPNHRGPLLIVGSIRLIGGSTPASGDSLVSIPLKLTIDDRKRKFDGSYDPGDIPACDRPLEDCCDPDEVGCYQIANHCIYVADGYDRQEVCINHQAEKSYEHIADLRVSSDVAHIVYLASFQCASGGSDVLCKRTVVMDHLERTGPAVATHLELSPDGQHYAYIARGACVLHAGEEVCSGTTHPIVDGVKVEVMPAWYRGK